VVVIANVVGIGVYKLGTRRSMIQTVERR